MDDSAGLEQLPGQMRQCSWCATYMPWHTSMDISWVSCWHSRLALLQCSLPGWHPSGNAPPFHAVVCGRYLWV